jgi:hypothetical protein
LLVGLCNKRAQGGSLSRQIDEVVEKADGRTPVIVRSTDYPSNPKAAVAVQLGELVNNGGRAVVVEDSDWRVMLASLSFRQQHGTEPAFAVWLKRSRPITSLKSISLILNLGPRENPQHAVLDSGQPNAAR